MKSDVKKEKASRFLFISCWIVYIFICMTKTNYVASIAYIVREGIFSKSNSGIISAAFYLMYGISQLLGGNIVDRVSPYRVMSISIIGSIITNAILIFTNNFRWVLVLWSLTGLIQFGVWPAVARIVAGFLIPEHKEKASVYISLGVAAGGILSYLVVTPVLEMFGWSGVFVMNSVLLLIALFLWKYAQLRTEKILIPEPAAPAAEKAVKDTGRRFLPLFFKSGLCLVMFMGIAQAMLDNGVKTWVPTMLMESYEISPVWASIQTAVMYICNIFGVFLLVRIFKRTESPVLTQTFYFLICLPCCMLMLFTGKIPAWLVFAALVICTTCTYAMTNIGLRVASAFDSLGYSGTVSGLINALVCFGVVIGNGGYGFIAEKFGWNAVTLVWMIVCLSAIAFGIPSALLWRRFTKGKTVKETDYSVHKSI